MNMTTILKAAFLDCNKISAFSKTTLAFHAKRNSTNIKRFVKIITCPTIMEMVHVLTLRWMVGIMSPLKHSSTEPHLWRNIGKIMCLDMLEAPGIIM